MPKRIRTLLPLLLLLIMIPLQALAAGLSPIKETQAVLDKGDKLSIRSDYDGDVEWKSSDKSIASVSRGVVSGRKAGTCVITATLEDGSAYTCEVTVTQPVTEVSIPSRKTLFTGDTYTIIPEIEPDNATDKSISYKSSDASVASVDENGVVTALKAGSATVTATAKSGEKDSIKITVKQAVTSISLSEDAITIDKGRKLTLTPTLLPLDATETDIEWKSSDKKIASVSRGTISARRVGTCVITATAESGVSVSCTVVVTQPVEDVSIPSRKTLYTGDIYAIIPEIEPSNATDKTITYKSSDASVASVDENGVVTAHKAGSATVTATAKSGEKDSIKITVKQPVTSVTLSESFASFDKGRKLTLTAALLPLDATEKDVEWKSSDKKIASVSSKGVVSARKAGTCIITATTENGLAASCTIVVTQPVEDVSLPSRKTIYVGDAYALVPEIKPSNATDKTIFYRSSDDTVASVDENGVVTAHKAGSATVTAAAKNGEKDSIKITVKQPVTSVILSETFVTLDKDKKLTLTASLLPLDATDKDVEWKSSDKKIASVSRGTVSARKAGTCVITATSENGVSASCTVVVTQPVTEVRLPSSKKVSRNTTYALQPEIRPSNATDKTITYTSSNPAVASVDVNGVVTGRMDGQAVITAAAKSGRKDTIKITVETTHVKSLTLDSYYLTLQPGSTGLLKAAVEPQDASVPGVRYESAQPSVATIDPSGVITAVAPGSTTITVTSMENASVAAVCQVFVRNPDSKGRLDGVVIGINPGHQIKGNFSKDPLAPGSKETGNKIGVGCTGIKTGNREYEINLQIGLMLRDRLEAEGATVVMTRTSNDVNITNIERAKMLNAANVDLALQLHCNSSATNDYSRNGIELYVKPDDQPAWTAAAHMLECMIKETGALDRGVKKSTHYMSLNWSETPAILVEMGYMSNKKEDVLLATPSYQAKLVEGMYEGIARYCGR